MRRVLLALLITLPLVAQEAPKAAPKPAPKPPGPYVTVYRDKAVAFQFRRDRITPRPDAEGTYLVWLRWLWAEPRPWKTDKETVRGAVADLDCKKLRVRELAVLHKNRTGTIYDSEQFEPEQQKWQSFDAKSGAGAALKRVCEFIPQLLKNAPPPTSGR
ncbi:MAG TPA: hypothetical protein VKB93_01295 [Thermoanaerobaculia bacterium]|nr:hypothetical protein [Thermoanaerobaculia bacterium]